MLWYFKMNKEKKLKPEKKLAAIVPIYNTEQYLPDCIESLIQQTVPFDEILLIDDGSSDHSLDICNKYQEIYSNIKVYSHCNSGVSYTRNYGMRSCNSDYILFMDSDDMLKLDTVRIIKEKLSTEACEIAVYDADIKWEIDEPGNSTNSYDKSNVILEGSMSGNEFLDYIYPDCYSSIVCMAVYKREFLMQNKIDFCAGISYSEDMLFGMQALLSAKRVYYISQKLYIRRCRENSASRTAVSEKKVKDCCLVAEKLADIIGVHLQNRIDYNEKYLSIVLFHYNIALYMQVLYERNNGCLTYKFKIDHVLNLINFLNRTTKIWKEGDNISNAQVALNIISQYKKAFYYNEKLYLYKKNHAESLLKETIREHVINKLSKLPFNNKTVTIAIYGTGNMADAIMNIYNGRIGVIKSKIVFIKSRAKKFETYNGYPVYNVENIPAEVQYIVISSYKFKNDMRKSLKENDIRIKIIDIYINEYFEVKLQDICMW